MNKSLSILPSVNLLVEQIVMAGNGIVETGVARSSKDTITGRTCHLCQMTIIDKTHAITDKTTETNHQILWEMKNFLALKILVLVCYKYLINDEIISLRRHL